MRMNFIIQRKKKTCFKSVHNSTFINFILVNKAIAFQNTTIASPGLSDFHKFVLAVLKTSITKSNTQKITYIDYKTFDSVRFNKELKYVQAIEKIKSCFKFIEMFLQILNNIAQQESKSLKS